MRYFAVRLLPVVREAALAFDHATELKRISSASCPQAGFSFGKSSRLSRRPFIQIGVDIRSLTTGR
jgi:hypothetical protein